MSEETLDHTINFLLQGIKELEIEELNISLHGGEPLLLNKFDFDNLCSKLSKTLKPKLKHFEFSIQTNGVLIDNEWINLFKKHNIQLGISIDGSKKDHDKFRVDHKGKGSYNKIVKSIELLKQKQYDFGILSVIDPTRDAYTTFNTFVNELRTDSMDFLLPDFTHDRPAPYSAEIYGKFINDLFSVWILNNNPKIKIRFFNSNINMFLGYEGLIYGQGHDELINDHLHIISIRSDGEICPTDELMSTDPNSVTLTGKNVNNTSLKDFFNLPIFKELSLALTTPPDKCRECCWQKVCGGGGLVNRFSKKHRFNNPSIYCSGLKIFYSRVLKELIANNVNPKEIAAHLLSTN
jgi:uncharacterized protein